jgi:hypothetical protein
MEVCTQPLISASSKHREETKILFRRGFISGCIIMIGKTISGRAPAEAIDRRQGYAAHD